jgi:hypothetical protein
MLSTVHWNLRADVDRELEQRLARLRSKLVRDDTIGHYRPTAILLEERGTPAQQRLLAWLRDHVNSAIPRAWYRLVLGHDLHVSTFAELYAVHYHANEPDPFTGAWGWRENLGRVSAGKVTTAFRDFEVDQLIAETSAYGDFKYHEVGTSTAAEANTQTALTTTTGIARVAGTQVEAAADQYRSVATVTADTSETWGEHGLFNASSAGTMMDRSLISPTVAVVSSDTVEFTYTLTKSAEA